MAAFFVCKNFTLRKVFYIRKILKRYLTVAIIGLFTYLTALKTCLIVYYKKTKLVNLILKE